MSIYGNIIQEKMLLNEDDIYYNKDKFDSREINICFITGHSGSGKSTMGRELSKDKNTEHYELDDVVTNKDNFTMENLKEYGDLIYSFFNGIGKKYYLTGKELREENKFEGFYEKELIRDFVDYSINYANKHKNKRFVLEGVWIYLFIHPSKLKDSAVYIKGTSRLVSDLRAAKRDSNNEYPDDGLKRFKSYMGRVKNFFTKEAIDSEKAIKQYRDYFRNLINKDQ